jgi:hypothetical protein
VYGTASGATVIAPATISAGIIRNSGVSCPSQQTPCPASRSGHSSCEAASAIASRSMSNSRTRHEWTTSTSREPDGNRPSPACGPRA